MRSSTQRLAAGIALVGALLGGALPHLVAADSGESAAPTFHVVETGETLWEIAAHFAPREDPRRFIHRIGELNGLEDSRVFPGQQLIIPAG